MYLYLSCTSLYCLCCNAMIFLCAVLSSVHGAPFCGSVVVCFARILMHTAFPSYPFSHVLTALEEK